VKPLTRSVTSIELCREDGEPLGHRCGQHVVLHFSDTDFPERYYSVATVPGDDPFGLCVKHTEGERPTHKLAVGEVVEVSGPFGSLVLRDEPAPALLFIAQGTGVTPFLSMLDAMAELLEDGRRVRVVLGFRRLSDVWCLDDFDELLVRYHGFDVEVVLTQPNPLEPSLRGRRVGALLDEFVWDLEPAETQVYLAGSREMVLETHTRMLELGFDRANIVTEADYV
jgi:ferredoxin-NADP reductase